MKKTDRTLSKNVKLLAWASCLNDVASEMIFPLLPLFLMTALGGSRHFLGIVEGIADSLGSLLKLASGAWSDRVGRRKRFVLFGYGLPALARPLLAVVTAPGQLLAIRVADRLGKGLRTSPRDAMIAESSTSQNRGYAFGFHRAMDHLGAAIGPVLAWLLLRYWPGQWRLVFALALIPGLIVLALVVAGLNEPPQLQPSPRLRLSLRPFGRDFRLYLLALLVFTLGNSSDAFLLVRANEAGVPDVLLPLLWLLFHLVKSAGNLWAGGWVDRLGPRPPIFVGWTLYAAVYLAFGWTTAPWQVWLLFVVYGLHFALTEPAEKTLVVQLAGAQHKGLAFGWYNFTIGIAALPASVIFGYLYDWLGPRWAFGWGAALATAAALVLASVRRPN